jgi:hypothetical protein
LLKRRLEVESVNGRVAQSCDVVDRATQAGIDHSSSQQSTGKLIDSGSLPNRHITLISQLTE